MLTRAENEQVRYKKMSAKPLQHHIKDRLWASCWNVCFDEIPINLFWMAHANEMKFDRNPNMATVCKKKQKLNSSFLHKLYMNWIGHKIAKFLNYNAKVCSTKISYGNVKTRDSLPCSTATSTLISIRTIELKAKIIIEDSRNVTDDLKNVSITRLKQPIGLFTVPFTRGCKVTRILKWDWELLCWMTLDTYAECN